MSNRQRKRLLNQNGMAHLMDLSSKENSDASEDDTSVPVSKPKNKFAVAEMMNLMEECKNDNSENSENGENANENPEKTLNATTIIGKVWGMYYILFHVIYLIFLHPTHKNSDYKKEVK